MKRSLPYMPLKKQTGAVLAVGLLLLLVMTLIGITAMNSTIMEEKMAGNYRDRDLAFQAAESALRDAEDDIDCDPSCDRSPQISGLTGFDTTCTNGLCYGDDTFDAAEHLLDPDEESNSTAYGAYTGATDLPSEISAAPPRYVIEGVIYQLPGEQPKYMYKVTAIGFGGSSTARVLVQSGYKP